MYFTLYKDKRGEWRWNFWSANHEDICISSESYTLKQGAFRGIALVKQGAAAARFYDDTTTTWS